MVSTASIKKRSKIQNDMVATFESSTGKSVLYHLIKTQGVLKAAYQKGNTCCDTAHQDGRRSVVLDILHFMNVDPNYFDRIIQDIERETYNG
jgi:hypothetical protein